jgi:hypothetical protein
VTVNLFIQCIFAFWLGTEETGLESPEGTNMNSPGWRRTGRHPGQKVAPRGDPEGVELSRHPGFNTTAQRGMK